MPWLVVGTLLTSVWPRQAIQRWALAAMAVSFLAGWALLPHMGWGEIREILFVLPGLALGLWVGEQAQRFEGLSAASAASPIQTIQAASADTLAVDASRTTAPAVAAQRAPPLQAARIAALALFVAALWTLIEFPTGRLALGLGLAAYAAALWRWPAAWLVVVPAALPLLDLAPWTGRFFWDEFDLLMLVTLAVALWQGQLKVAAWQVPKLNILLALFVPLTCASLLLGLFPLQAWDLNAWSAYWSHYNSLRLAKGLLWGLVFFGLYRSLPHREEAFKRLASGMALGVLGVSAWALWEQAQFAGTAATLDYRVTAGFSSMHTGGGHFEAYLVMSLPFVWGLSFMLRKPLQRVLPAAIFLLGAYALFATVARGGAIALGIALAVLTTGTWLAQRGEASQRPGRRARFAVPVAIGLLTVAVMIAGASGMFWQQRIAQTAVDADIRLRHWSAVLDLRETGWATALFGQGLGTLPEATLMSRLPEQAGSYRHADDGGNTTLALNSAGTLYMAQRVAPRPAQTLTVQMRARVPAGKAGLEASLCEKNLFNSRRCQWLKLEIQPDTTTWQTFQQTLSSGDVGAGNFFTRRPVQFSLYNPVPGSVIEIDDVRLLDGTGQDLLKNGDFSRGGDYWFFNSGDHLFWHAKNLWVHLLFEQGWLGLLSFSLILVLAMVRLGRAVRRGGLEATVWLAALAAAATVGMVDSLVDATRLATLVYGVMFVGAAWGASPWTSAAADSPLTHDDPHGDDIHRQRPAAPGWGAPAALRSRLG